MGGITFNSITRDSMHITGYSVRTRMGGHFRSEISESLKRILRGACQERHKMERNESVTIYI